jgi:hypothetical protein
MVRYAFGQSLNPEQPTMKITDSEVAVQLLSPLHTPPEMEAETDMEMEMETGREMVQGRIYPGRRRRLTSTAMQP